MNDSEIRALPPSVRDAFEHIPMEAFDTSAEIAPALAELDAANAAHATAFDRYIEAKSAFYRLDTEDVQAGTEIVRLTAKRAALLPGMFMDGTGTDEAASLLAEIERLRQRRRDWQEARPVIAAGAEILQKPVGAAAFQVGNATSALQTERDRLRLDEARRLAA